jgi:aminoglycoside phosphotransferase (APT) family kinase protein
VLPQLNRKAAPLSESNMASAYPHPDLPYIEPYWHNSCAICDIPRDLPRPPAYKSHVKLCYLNKDLAVWYLGSEFVLKERPEGYALGLEHINLDFLREKGITIPIPEVARELVDDDKRHFTLTKRIQGTTLKDAWKGLTLDEKIQIADETIEYLRQLRKHKATSLQGITGGGVKQPDLFGNNQLSGPFTSDKELWNNLEKQLQEVDVPEDEQTRLHALMPECASYILSHANLCDENIMVKEKSLTGILDWEFFGYFPAWWEFGSLIVPTNRQNDSDWISILKTQMAQHHEFQIDNGFWMDYSSVYSKYSNA